MNKSKTGPKPKPPGKYKDWIKRAYTRDEIKQLGGKEEVNLLIDRFIYGLLSEKGLKG